MDAPVSSSNKRGMKLKMVSGGQVTTEVLIVPDAKVSKGSLIPREMTGGPSPVRSECRG